MPVVLSVVGRSQVGKTTFLEKLVPEIKRRGYTVGTIKHDAHDHFEMDKAGKDTWRHREAGSQTVAIGSPTRFALIKKVSREMDLDTIVASYFPDEDLVLTEGYKSGNKTKIEICRKEVHSEPLCGEADRLAAVVSDFPVALEVPCFDLEDISGVAEFMEKRFLSHTTRPNVILRLDGRKLPIKSFVRDFLMGGILGMISTLRGYENPAQIDISIRLRKR
ncbi:MAG: molybdopterin-guanine dinucleotide biosynthesis protein B [Deltaproteobacteria bacterium]|nr:MAG: molybdopterin-guanine dinucleotide biosynthesis protein B [Deltaproteobacteria bacterium]